MEFLRTTGTTVASRGSRQGRWPGFRDFSLRTCADILPLAWQKLELTCTTSSRSWVTPVFRPPRSTTRSFPPNIQPGRSFGCWKEGGRPSVTRWKQNGNIGVRLCGRPGDGSDAIICKEKGYVARPAGFEPATYGFEVRRSIQLSYGRAGFILTRIHHMGRENCFL